MVPIRVKRGYDLKLTGAPTREIRTIQNPAQVAVIPCQIPFIRPRLAVAVGDSVRTGSVLFADKRNPDVKFASPGSGKVARIDFGPRRVIQSIVIDLDKTERPELFATLTEAQLDDMDRSELVDRILAGGLWPLIRALPYRDYAPPRSVPPTICVTLGSGEPFLPAADVYLHGREDLFAFGLKILSRLSENQLVVAAHDDIERQLPLLSDYMTHTVRGAYPAVDPGVVIYHAKSTPAENRAWFIDGQDVLLLAQLLKTGRYPTHRTMVVAGPMAQAPMHVETRMGIPLADLVRGVEPATGCRYVVGGVLTGFAAGSDGYMGFYETALNLLPEGRDREFLALFDPGYAKPSYSRAFLSALRTNSLTMDCNTHGGLRACIACNHCPAVCPVEILPQLAYKSILIDEVDEALAHGLLDCVQCGLCSYVCPSKLPLVETLTEARAAYYKEQT
ncbi:MAG: 4Fe-4S dicluster domain-containing protein [Deltaproteobacteria bacterium]|nr:4Fe-4S dicluster domain-containing protein [Deltaproteobacteria bacterium]